MTWENYSFSDSNGDGLGDVGAADLNGDGQIDSYAIDSNYDGSIDTYQVDGNGDQYFEGVASDNNQDGVVEEIGVDTNLDGVIDATGFDQDQNGVAEVVTVDRDGDGIQEFGAYDVNQDGQVDTTWSPETGYAQVATQLPEDPALTVAIVGGPTQGGVVDPLLNSPVIMNDPRGAGLVADIMESQRIMGLTWTLPDNFEIVKRDY